MKILDDRRICIAKVQRAMVKSFETPGLGQHIPHCSYIPKYRPYPTRNVSFFIRCIIDDYQQVSTITKFLQTWRTAKHHHHLGLHKHNALICSDQQRSFKAATMCDSSQMTWKLATWYRQVCLTPTILALQPGTRR